MPRDPFKPLTPQEQAFVFHWVREGCHVENMAVVERKAKVPKGKGLSILQREHVHREIEARKALVELEQARLIARDQNRAAEKDDKRREVTLDKIEARLDEVMQLDVKTHGSLVLAAIHTGLVYTGVIRNKNMERTIPVKDPTGDLGNTASNNVYSSIFSDMRAEAAHIAQLDQTPAPLNPSDRPALPPVAPPPPRPPAPKAVPAPGHKTIEIEIS